MAGIIIYLSFSDDVFWPIIFYACVFAFSFCAFLQHCPIHHLPLKLRYASIFLQFVTGLINTPDELMSTLFFRDETRKLALINDKDSCALEFGAVSASDPGAKHPSS
jgi:hypothetical protein